MPTHLRLDTGSDYWHRLAALPDAARWLPPLQQQVAYRLDPDAHGDLPRWQALLAALPPLSGESICHWQRDIVTLTPTPALSPPQQQVLVAQLQQLRPWRKGPFRIAGVTIDSEWRSDWKWRRVVPHIAPLAGRRVLDVGCGNGYYSWRMVGAGAAEVVGVDPTLLFFMQWLAVRHFAGSHWPLTLLPIPLAVWPPEAVAFDTLFSMGVLYHRPDPVDHLRQLAALLRPGGELVLETLILDRPGNAHLQPRGRYAQMRNVHAIATPSQLLQWLDMAGFDHARCVDVTPTRIAEQRATDWMTFQSLADFLDPTDHWRTIEGYPAPVRGVLIATRR